MKSESEIEKRIDELSVLIKIIRIDTHTDNVLKRMLMYYEIRHLYWVLDKPIPEEIDNILSRLNIAIEKH